MIFMATTSTKRVLQNIKEDESIPFQKRLILRERSGRRKAAGIYPCTSNMHMRRNKTAWLRRSIIFCGIASCIAGATILIIPLFISEDFVQQKVAQAVKDRFEYVKGVGPVSFQRPNRFTIGHLTLQRQEQNEDSPIVMENIKGALSLFPLLREKIIVKKLSIQQINYENRLLIKDLVTDSLSFSDGIVSTCMRLNINEGPTTLKGMVDFRRQEPAFDLTFEAKDVHLTEDIPILEFLPLFTVKGGEVWGGFKHCGFSPGQGDGQGHRQ